MLCVLKPPGEIIRWDKICKADRVPNKLYCDTYDRIYTKFIKHRTLLKLSGKSIGDNPYKKHNTDLIINQLCKEGTLDLIFISGHYIKLFVEKKDILHLKLYSNMFKTKAFKNYLFKNLFDSVFSYYRLGLYKNIPSCKQIIQKYDVSKHYDIDIVDTIDEKLHINHIPKHIVFSPKNRNFVCD